MTIGEGIGRKIQHHIDAARQQIDHQRLKYSTNLLGTALVVGNALDLTRVETGQPLVFAEHNGCVLGGEGLGECGLAGGDLAA